MEGVATPATGPHKQIAYHSESKNVAPARKEKEHGIRGCLGTFREFSTLNYRAFGCPPRIGTGMDAEYAVFQPGIGFIRTHQINLTTT